METNKQKWNRRIDNIITTGTILAILGGFAYAGYQGRKINQNHELSHRVSNIERIGETTLTDMDYDGKWDVAEVKQPGRYRIYFKSGYGPSQSISQLGNGPEVQIVEPEFFDKYESATTPAPQPK